MYELRLYQAECVAAVLDQLANARRTLVVMATGTGKTSVFCDVARHFVALGSRVLIVVHREELVFQARDRIREVLGVEAEIEMGAARASGGMLRSPVVITTVQTMSRASRASRFDPQEFALVILDEAHHAVAGSWRKLLGYYEEKNPEIRILGVTATPDRFDEEALGQIFETVAYEYGILNGIRDGWLVGIQQFYVRVKALDFSRVRTRGGDFHEAELAALMEQERVLHEVVTPTIEIAAGRQTLVFAVSVAQAVAMEEVFNRHRDGSAVSLDGETPREVRRQRVRDFKEGRVQFLVNCALFLEGTDLPNAAVLAMARPTKSRALYAQACGRVLRPLPGVVDSVADGAARLAAIAASDKPRATVIDFVGNSGRHSLISAADILGGEVSERTLEAAKERIAAGNGADLGVLEQFALIEEETRRRLEQVEREKRRRLVASATYSKREVDPFAVWSIPQSREPAWHAGKPASEAQLKSLQKSKIPTPNGLTFWQAHQLLNERGRRIEKNLCSYNQAKTLIRYGLSAEATFEEAHATLDALAANGWRPTAEMRAKGSR